MSKDPSYTVFIRLPFPRDDFIDPPSVEWDAAKEKALWKILSKASKNSDINWDEQRVLKFPPVGKADTIAFRAIKFDVPLPFLLQQTAWIYERQLVQVRAQMRKVGQPKGMGSAIPSPIPGSTSESAAAVGEAMRRTGSGGGIRGTAALSTRRDSPVQRIEAVSGLGIGVGRAGGPPISRTSSANTTVTTRNMPQTQTSPRPAAETLQRPTTMAAPKASPSVRSSSAASSSSETSSSDSVTVSSRLLRRPRFSNKLGQSEDADDDEEDEPAFMPVSTHGTSGHDPGATLRGDPTNTSQKRPSGPHRKSMEVVQEHHRGVNSQTSDSSASSTAPAVLPRRGEQAVGRNSGKIGGGRGMAGPLSPKRTAELSGKGREGSEGSPSMGSSFSDLDDASVTQSALEEALASNMQHGGMASRMSTISQALRSKYL